MAVEAIDRTLGDKLGIPQKDRALGVLDLTGLRLAMVRPDAMFYAASVSKICILLAYFETHLEAAEALSPEARRQLGMMIKASDNAMAAKYGRLVGMERVQKIIQSRRYRFYDREHGGGLWYASRIHSAETALPPISSLT